MNITSKFPELRAGESDPRKRYYLRPTRVMLTRGEVTDADQMLLDRIGQISFDTSGCCVMRNGDHDSERALILLDLGREIHGSVRLLVQSIKPMRSRLRIRFGESATEALTPVGERGSTNDHSSRDFEIKVSDWSGVETNESGFRFVAIELLDDNCTFNLKAVEGVLIIRDVDYVGSFECSDKLINDIYNTAAYTAHLNMQEYMWDGIKRDRLVWIGDMHPEVMTICSVFGDNDVVGRSLDSVRDVTPLVADPNDKHRRSRWMNGFPAYSIWWIMCHYDYYMQNGNEAYLAEQSEYLSGLLDLLCEHVAVDGSENLPAKFLDWPTNDDPDAKHAGLQGLMCLGITKGAYLLEQLGKTEQAKRCLEVTERMYTNVPTTDRKQAAALLALSGIADADTINREVILPGRGRGYSTFYSYYILAAKVLADDTEAALEDMKEYYGGMLKLGATTFWEDFDLDWTVNEKGEYDANRIDELVPEGGKDIHADFGKYCYVGLRHSFCHGWSSGPVTFLARHILGVTVLEPGCKKVSVKPCLCGLEYVKGSYPTPYGKIEIYADKNGVRITKPDEVEVV